MFTVIYCINRSVFIMSCSELHRFNQRLKQDNDFFLQFTEAVKIGGDHAVVEFASSHCFDFTLEEYRLLSTGNNQEYNQPLTVGIIDRVFIGLSGASPQILGTCPESEQKRQATLGGAVLIPTLFAAIASSIMLATLNVHPFFIVIFAFLWMSIVLLMDRALLATYSHASSGWKKLGQISLRMVIAFLIAVTISHPVALNLFNETISTEYEKTLKEKRKEWGKQCDSSNASSDIAIRKGEIEIIKKNLSPNAEPLDLDKCKKPPKDVTKLNDALLANFEGALSKTKTDKINLENEIQTLTDRSMHEEKGDGINGATNIPTCGTVCKSIKKRIEEKNKLVPELDKQILDLNIKIENRKHSLAEELKIENQRVQLICESQLKTEATQKEAIWKQNINVLENSNDKLNQQYLDLSKKCLEKSETIDNTKPDIITQIGILNSLIFQQDGVAWDKLFVFLSFALLFMAIDMLAVTLKMASAGIYEVKADMMEYANAIHSFCQIRHEAILHFSKLSEREQEYLDDLQEGGGKEGLRVNLNKIIEAFNKADAKKLAGFFKRYLSGK